MHFFNWNRVYVRVLTCLQGGGMYASGTNQADGFGFVWQVRKSKWRGWREVNLRPICCLQKWQLVCTHPKRAIDQKFVSIAAYKDFRFTAPISTTLHASLAVCQLQFLPQKQPSSCEMYKVPADSILCELNFPLNNTFWQVWAVFDSNKIIAPSILYQSSKIGCHINCMHIGYLSMQDWLKKYLCNGYKCFSQSDALIRCGCIFQMFTIFLSQFLLYQYTKIVEYRAEKCESIYI
jgi:hypothetical protein